MYYNMWHIPVVLVCSTFLHVQCRVEDIPLPSKSYEGYEIFLVKVPKDHIKAVTSFIKETYDVHLNAQVKSLTGTIRPDVDNALLVPPALIDGVQALLSSLDISSRILTKNLQNDIEKEAKQNWEAKQAAKPKNPGEPYDILRYFARHDEVYEWMQSVANSSPFATLEYVGKSYQGRELHAMKISTGGSGKMVFWVDCGLHAREWLTVPVCNYIIDKLVKGARLDPEITRMLDAHDFYILPVANPDGYEYTFTDNRMWRKTRTPTNERDNISGDFCNGTDPNRNFGYYWNASGGASDYGCEDDYRGPSAFSENNTRAMRDYMRNLGRMSAYMSMHSFSLLWMVPWGYTSQSRPEDATEMDRLGEEAMDATILTHGEDYIFGTVPELLYVATGSSMDWAKGSMGVRYTYTLELRPSSLCNCNGFVVAPYEIQPTSEEVWEGVKTVALGMRWD